MRFLLPEALAVALTYRKAHPCAGFSPLCAAIGVSALVALATHAHVKVKEDSPLSVEEDFPFLGKIYEGLICAGPLGPAPCTRNCAMD